VIGRLTAALSRELPAELPREMSRVKQLRNNCSRASSSSSSGLSSSLQLFGISISLRFPRRYGSPTALSPPTAVIQLRQLLRPTRILVFAPVLQTLRQAASVAAACRRIRDHANTTAARQLLKNLTPVVNRSLDLFLRSCEALLVRDVIYFASSFAIYLARLAAICE
jgi:hypothetical protein